MRSLSLAVVLGSVAIACSSFGGSDSSDTAPAPSGGDDAGPDGNSVVTGVSPDYALSIAPVNDAQTIIQGKDTTVPIVLTRGKSLTGPITITITGFTNGVTAAPLTITGTTGNLVLSSPTGAQGDAQGMIEATIDTHKATTPLKTFVRGAPGALDTTWGTNGQVLAYSGNSNYGTVDLLLGPDDDVYSVSAVIINSNEVGGGRVAHLDMSGKLDPIWGTAGVGTFNGAYPRTAALTPDGGLVLVGGGYVQSYAGPLTFLSRMANTGVAVYFNENGTPAGGTLDGTAYGAYAVAVRPADSHIFYSFDNYVSTTETACGNSHFDATGAPVATYGAKGSERNTVSLPSAMYIQKGATAPPLVILSIAQNVVDYVQYNSDTGAALADFMTPKTISIPSVSRPVVGGGGLFVYPDDSIAAPFNGTGGFYVVKLDANGNPFAGFGTSGIVGPFNVAGSSALATGIFVDADGKILVAMDTGGVVRLTPAGVLDATFGTNGFAPTTTGTSLHRKVVVQKNGGRILVSGQGATAADTVVSAYWP